MKQDFPERLWFSCHSINSWRRSLLELMVSQLLVVNKFCAWYGTLLCVQHTSAGHLSKPSNPGVMLTPNSFQFHFTLVPSALLSLNWTLLSCFQSKIFVRICNLPHFVVPPSRSFREYETKIPITEFFVMQLMLIPRVFSVSSIKTFPSSAPDVQACGKTISGVIGWRWKDEMWEEVGGRRFDSGVFFWKV